MEPFAIGKFSIALPFLNGSILTNVSSKCPIATVIIPSDEKNWPLLMFQYFLLKEFKDEFNYIAADEGVKLD